MIIIIIIIGRPQSKNKRKRKKRHILRSCQRTKKPIEKEDKQ